MTLAITVQMMNMVTIQGYSATQIHHFIRFDPADEEDESEEEEADENGDEDNPFDEMAEDMVVLRGRKINTKKRYTQNNQNRDGEMPVHADGHANGQGETTGEGASVNGIQT